MTDKNKVIILHGDLNIDWFSKDCPLRKKLQNKTLKPGMGFNLY